MSKDKTIVIVSGPLGAGKSSLCKMISKDLDFFYIDGDAFFVPLEDFDITWEERLQKSWEWIVDQTKSHVQNGESVVIDFVVEDELPWFLAQVSGLGARVKYVVLIADQNIIKQRLEKRDGSLQYFERSKVLLEQLKNDSYNNDYLLNTTDMTTKETFDQVMNDGRFVVR